MDKAGWTMACCGICPFYLPYVSAEEGLVILRNSWEISAEFCPRIYLFNCYLKLKELKLRSSTSPENDPIRRQQAILMGEGEGF